MWPHPFPASQPWQGPSAWILPNRRPERLAGVPVLTIDGPSGSGKGTVSRVVAKKLGWALLDSGALYRLVALAGRRAGVALDDAAALAHLAHQFDIRFGS